MKLAELGEHENLPYNLQADTTVLQYKAIMDENNLINCGSFISFSKSQEVK